MNRKFSNIVLPLLAVTLFSGGLALGYALHRNTAENGRPEAKIGQILEIISDNYVDDVNLDSIVEASIPSLLKNLDPHTAYIPAKDLADVNAELEGAFSGVGISFQVINDTITIVEIISGGPAEKVGLMAGDRIVEVNDSLVAGQGISADGVRSLLRGPAGSKVDLKVKRATSSAALPFTVTRGEIPVTSIDASYMIDDSIGYVKVNKFGRNTYEEFFTEMTMLRAVGAKDAI
ncbi:MAG: PDZ domain-containing protein, partial [Muribaculaceae bacterium]|nr:PDZ domain-containing protein [Muribaculaceae bacterium]